MNLLILEKLQILIDHFIETQIKSLSKTKILQSSTSFYLSL